MEEKKQDLKEAIEIAPGAGQPETTEEEVVEAEVPQEPVEDITTLPQWAQDKIKKEQEEKENYKKGLLSVKKKTLTPEQPKKVEENVAEIEEYPDWDEASKMFQKQTLNQAESIAERKAKEMFEKYNEKTGISKFIAEHKELSDDVKWNEVIINYTPKNGRDTVEGIMEDLNRAYILTQYEKGELNLPNKNKDVKSGVANAQTISKTTSKSVSDGKTLSESARKLAQRMKVDPEKLAKEDDSLHAEIQF